MHIYVYIYIFYTYTYICAPIHICVFSKFPRTLIVQSGLLLWPPTQNSIKFLQKQSSKVVYTLFFYSKKKKKAHKPNKCGWLAGWKCLADANDFTFFLWESFIVGAVLTISSLPLVSRIMCAMMHAKVWMTSSCRELHIYWGVGPEMYFFFYTSLSLPYSLFELSPC